jgi:hypothetical protein
MSRLRISTIIATLAIISPLPALAADFTFNVPVTITNMPAAQQLTVLCSVKDRHNYVVGSFASSIPVVNGQFTGTVTVEFNANDGIHPSLAINYSCYVDVTGVDPSGRSFAAQYMMLQESWQMATGQPVTITPQNLVSGAISH